MTTTATDQPIEFRAPATIAGANVVLSAMGVIGTAEFIALSPAEAARAMDANVPEDRLIAFSAAVGVEYGSDDYWIALGDYVTWSRYPRRSAHLEASADAEKSAERYQQDFQRRMR